MKKIGISECMDEAVIETLKRGFEVLYDPALVDQPQALGGVLRDAHAAILRDRTQVSAALLGRRNSIAGGGPAWCGPRQYRHECMCRARRRGVSGYGYERAGRVRMASTPTASPASA
jgi:hypothetical protein